MDVLVGGASGWVGQALVPALARAGHRVIPLVRGGARPGAVSWDPDRGRLDPAALEGIDAVIHLGGVSIAGGPWTAGRRRQIVESRVGSTGLLAGAMAARVADARVVPRTFIVASATGWYGARGDAPLDETAGPGPGFLADVCRAWEAAADPARAAGVRVVHPRIGVVLEPGGGMLGRLLPLFRLGLGGPVGPGTQVLSWISRHDLVRVLAFLLEADLAGPVNATAPAPVTNAEFSAALARALGRPAFLRVPAFAVRTALGAMGQELLLSGARVLPARLLAAGFAFDDPRLEALFERTLRRGAA